MDSPLSDIEANEIIADSEDEGHRRAAGNRASASSEPLHGADRQQPASINTPDDQIDYFAGFRDDMFLPVPSIAERAKTRQRKPKAKPTRDILELTDDDEFTLNPRPSKSKKKTKKTVQDFPKTDQGANSSSASAPPIPEPQNGPIPLINARNKVRPRLVKKTPLPPHSPQLDPISQVTLPVPISPPRPLLGRVADSSSRSELPPSDPPLTSPLARDRDTHLPPIEFLLPQEDTDTPLPSSLPGENVDELQDRHDQPDVDPGDILLPPHPTFFAASSSFPPPVAPTLLLPPPHPVDIVDLTDIPGTAIAPPMSAPDSSTKTKVKKPRKPRKKKGEVGNVDLDAVEEPQVNSRRKGKARMNQVTVEIPLPPPVVDREQDAVLTIRKRRRKQILDDPLEEDELNIGVGQPDPFADASVSHSSPPSNNEQPQGDLNILDPDELTDNPPRAEKRKGRKRRSTQEVDGSIPSATVSRKRKKTLHPIEAGEQEQTFGEPPKRMSKKGKKGIEGPDNIEVPQAPGTKGKKRMVIAEDDEGDGNVDPIVEEPRASSPDPEEHLKINGKLPPEDDAAKAADRQDDRNVLRDIQSTEAQGSSPSGGTVTPPQKRYETPAAKYPSLASRYTIAPKNRTSGMTELIRRASTHVNPPLAAPNARGSPLTQPVYSPLLKSSRRSLSRIAPLHPNRKTPPPPLPPPPPKKKSKKEQELEEKWEEEIIEEIGGINEWLALSEREKKDLKRLKRDREMGYCED